MRLRGSGPPGFYIPCANAGIVTPSGNTERRTPLPATGAELPLAPGMCWALQPSAVVAGRAVSLGGTVLIGEHDPIELSPFTARMLRAPATGPPAACRQAATS